MLLTDITVIVHLVLGAEPAKNAADHRLDTALEVRRHSPAGDSESANGHSRRQPARARRAFEAQARSSVWATTRISGNHFCFRHRLHACAAPAADSDSLRKAAATVHRGPGGGEVTGARPSTVTAEDHTAAGLPPPESRQALDPSAACAGGDLSHYWRHRVTAAGQSRSALGQ